MPSESGCGIDCTCKECKKIRKLLRDKTNSGELHLVGLPEDKKKIMQETKT